MIMLLIVLWVVDDLFSDFVTLGKFGLFVFITTLIFYFILFFFGFFNCQCSMPLQLFHYETHNTQKTCKGDDNYSVKSRF